MALDKTSAIQTFSPDTDDIAASFPCSCENRALLHKVREENEKRRILFYVCNIPKNEPNTVLKSELYECTALAAIGYLFGFDGFLRWAYTCWTERPLEDIRYNNTALPAGDVNFVYPAKNGGVLYSVRYFALKRMLQLMEAMQLLNDRGRGQDVEAALPLHPQKYRRLFLDAGRLFSRKRASSRTIPPTTRHSAKRSFGFSRRRRTDGAPCSSRSSCFAAFWLRGRCICSLRLKCSPVLPQKS